MKTSGLDAESLEMTLQSLRDFAEQKLPVARLLQLDHDDEFPEDAIREMCNPKTLGVQLVFIQEAYGGFGGSAWDVYRTCELVAAIDLGVATGVLATFLGSDPISFGGTEEQKKHWLGRIAEEGILFAYGATEPAAGSDLGALKTTATPVVEDGKVTGYRLNGAKQWISNGGYADVYTILANAPAGPTWFILEKGTEGFTHGKPEDKHGIRASNTAALSCRTSSSRSRTWSAASKGRGSSRRSSSSATPASWSPPSASAPAGRRSTGRSRIRRSASRAAAPSPKSRATPTSSSFRTP